MSVRNLNDVAGDFIDVTFDGGESFRLFPLEELVLSAEDCSAESSHGKLNSKGITIAGNGVHVVNIRCNYTYYTEVNFAGMKVETR